MSEANRGVRGITRVPGLLYGGDYNPEQWPEEVWAEDARLMREAGVTLVTVGVFSWARLQPGPDEWDFGWFDRVLGLLAEHGVAADIATATASPPAWLVRARPEILPVTADGVRLEFGSRQHYCPSSPVYRDAAARLARTIGDRYRDHPALAMWHVHNEYGDHVTECFCEASAADFRCWLRDRYGDVAALNAAWATDFWSQRYGTFEEIEPPRTAPGPVNPTQALDWRRFCSDALLGCYLREKAELDEVAPGVPVTTNFMSMFKPLDYWTWAAHEDVVSDDAYPDPADPEAHVGAAMNYDLMRSLKGGRPWLLMEQAPSAVSWRPVNVPKPPALARLWSLQTVAHGADGVLHFQWRASRAGAEKFHSALLPHRGTEGRQWAATVALGRDLARLAEVAGTRIASEVAIVLDWNSWWALELDDRPSARLRLRDLVRTWYATLADRNVAVDFVPPNADLAGYRLVLAPNLYLTAEATAARLTSYVAGGGRLVCGFFSGIVDEHDHVHLGGYPAPLRDVLGVVVDEFWPIPDDASVAVSLGGRRAAATLWSEWLEPLTADVAGTYLSGELEGRPAVTRNAHGEGRAWYVGCHLGDAIGLVLDEALADSGVLPVLDAAPGVEVTRRDGSGHSYYFLLNQSGEERETPAPDGTDLLTGAGVRRSLRLPPYGAAVVKTARA